MGDGVGAQRILVGLDGERGAARQADAGVVARAHLRIDPEARAHQALAGRQLARVLWPDAPLPGELAFAVGDDHLEAPAAAAQRFAQHTGDAGHSIGAHALDPPDTQALQGGLHVEARAAASRLFGAREDLLLAGGAGIAVVHDDQHRVVLVEDGAGNARDETVVPQAAVAHDADGSPPLCGRNRGGGGQ